jgi:hypothetical protein
MDVQRILVAVIVGIAILVSTWKLMPARRRLRTLLAFDVWAAKRPWLSRWRERSLKPRIARAAGSGCAGCAANVGIKPHQPRR